ncbi:hypothetical protein SELMODRAFT_412021 [Selaginella moellendorffii]|uniref:Tryptophan synthase beta chain-like PALP domain-containing protein n=1 Tax=Selaginella moellendorffii TaxID=88036 RepID=D8RJT2_SELML|nr:hypothetical protein SELMODRAFT_412021 [Selaginella moellendorffii]
MQLSGNKVRKLEFLLAEAKAVGDMLVEKLRAQGRTPYLIPVGGSNSLGAWGYICAAREIEQQVEAGTCPRLDEIVMACGRFMVKESVTARTISTITSRDSQVNPRDIVRLVDAQGLGYATGEFELVKEISEATGVILDPVYSGKALHGRLRHDLLFPNSGPAGDGAELYKSRRMCIWGISEAKWQQETSMRDSHGASNKQAKTIKSSPAPSKILHVPGRATITAFRSSKEQDSSRIDKGAFEKALQQLSRLPENWRWWSQCRQEALESLDVEEGAPVRSSSTKEGKTGDGMRTPQPNIRVVRGNRIFCHDRKMFESSSGDSGNKQTVQNAKRFFGSLSCFSAKTAVAQESMKEILFG